MAPLEVHIATQTYSHDAKQQVTGIRAMAALSGSVFALPSSGEVQACWELCRLHNNIGFWVVWLPVAWGLAMVYHAQPELSAMVCLTRAAVYVPFCFGVKSLIMTIDDILDRDIDGLVERTKLRALPRGAITPTRAWLFFAMQVFIGVSSAVAYLSPKALLISMIVWPLYIIYPTCKRWMDLAPIPLGLMFKIGLFMGWADVSLDGSVAWNTLVPAYLGACLWTITYETVYQHQDKLDDVKIGVRSAALLCGSWTIPICTVTGWAFFGLMGYSGVLNGHALSFFVSLGTAAVMLLTRLAKTNVDKPEDCKHLFMGTPAVGQVILVGLVVDAVVQRIQSGIPL